MDTIQRLTAQEASAVISQLVSLLQNAVDHGASVGFIRPLTDEIAQKYWEDVIAEIEYGSRILLVTSRDGMIIGSVQLGLCTRQNGLHRAEVQKLFVHTSWRCRGIAKALMNAIEEEARIEGRSLLYLDTEPGKPAEVMYERMGWTRVGEIPEYACNPDGDLHSTVIFFRKIT